MEPKKHYQSINFYIRSAKDLKKELLKYETEYHPEKVRSLINSYKFTIAKIISHCEAYLRTEKDDWKSLSKIEALYKKYKNFLKTL